MSHPNDRKSLGQVAHESVSKCDYCLEFTGYKEHTEKQANAVAAEVRRRDGDNVSELTAEVERLKECCEKEFEAYAAADHEVQRLNKSIEILRPNAELREFAKAVVSGMALSVTNESGRITEIAGEAVRLAKATLAELAKEGAE